MSNQDIYQKVTDIILEALDRGVVPWHRPWRNVDGGRNLDRGGLHRNLVSKKSYRGVNQFLCEISAASQGFTSPYWLSFKQAKAKGGKVRKGEKGTLVVFWKISRRETKELDSKGKPVVKTIPLLKYFYVFNSEQCDGITIPQVEAPEPEPKPEPEFDANQIAQAVIDNMPERPSISHYGNSAFYTPALDTVTLPVPEAFETPDHYYTTAYHELAHSTGHKKRLGDVTDWTKFGSDPYAKEELRAEMTAAMLCGVVGMNTTFEQSASYVANWSQRFQQDPKLIVSAAGAAQRASDYILGTNANGEAEAENIAQKETTHA